MRSPPLALIRGGELDRFLTIAPDLEPADLADVLAQLDDEERLDVVRRLPAEVSAEALVEMPEEAHAEDTLTDLGPERAAEIVEEMEDDDAADLLATLEPEEQEAILAEVEDRADVDRLLRYDEESAGGLMTGQVVTVSLGSTVADALESVRRQSEEVEDFHQVFVVDGEGRLRGTLDFKALVVSPAERPVVAMMEPAELFVRQADQEEVARLMSRYTPSLAVVDDRGVLLGRITDDVIDVVRPNDRGRALRRCLGRRGSGRSADRAAGWPGCSSTC
jgi:magnesium transporter